MKNKIFAMLVGSSLALAVQINAAEAATRTYEAGGRKYSYDTRDPLQVQAARKLIDAANAADAAKAKAEAERASNPLVRLIGSQVQTEATRAQERLQQAIAEHEKAAAKRPKTAPPLERQAAPAEANRPSEASVGAPVGEPSTQRNDAAAADPAAATPSRAAAASSARRDGERAVKSVFVDVASGIKTTFMVDGSIHEEPVETVDASEGLDRASSGATTGSVRSMPQP